MATAQESNGSADGSEARQAIENLEAEVAAARRTIGGVPARTLINGFEQGVADARATGGSPNTVLIDDLEQRVAQARTDLGLTSAAKPQRL